ncbi:DUF11 domain-containing protein [Pontibacter sp. KCTC 32443]|uniref:T9SS type A sorting domain-containing protein n=1 Tax=Pontibacter TaxID=323449 RepID=UPI00164E9EF7|nr:MULTISPECIES: T9SS type A sorting domain-containing protein [Pontibacter]MBC5773419.1 DUF11 domain-containing protein [Pontibacter sp. KCTC 32443]
MNRLLLLCFFVCSFFPLQILAEGSKNLTPNTTGSPSALTDPNNTRSGYLAHDANFAAAAGVAPTSLSFLKSAGFNYNGAVYSADHRLYVRVLPGETVHYGVHRTSHDQGTGNQGDLIITARFRNADGTEGLAATTTLLRNTKSTRDSELITTQAGVIVNAAQAAAGPVALAGTAGYQSLSITNTSTQTRDYFFEFNQVGEDRMTQEQRFSVYDFWDFTVLDTNKNEKTGRLFSKLWAFSAGGTSNVFSRNFNMYPLIPSETQPGKYYVKVLELAGIAPQNFFRFVTNSMGTTNGTTFEERRKSQTINSDYPEYYNFVNNPDPAIWPTATAPTFSVNVTAFCSNSITGRGGVTFTGTSSESSTFIVLIDLNNNGTYDPGTADVLLEKTGAAGNKVITWDGLNGLGQVVPNGTTLKYYFKNGSGPINFPMWDAETNLDGFRVGEVRPLPAGTSGQNYVSKLYWDDSKLATARFPAPQTQLFGLAAAGSYDNLSGGVHKWGNTTSNTTAGDLYTTNTWTYGYTNELEQSHVYTFDCSVDLVVTNTVSAGSYTVGKPLTYTVTIVNNGPELASGVTLSDLLDNTKLELISATASHGSYNSTTGIWNVTDMGSGATRTLTITAKPKITGSISQVASINSLDQADRNTTNNSATATITVVPSADIEVKNMASGTTFNNGDEVTYTITAKNLGPNNATGVAITDLLPSGLTLVNATTATGTYNATDGIWTLGALSNGATATLTLKATINKLGTITTTATLNSRAGFELDDQASNNTASNTVTVLPTADVAVTNTVNNTSPNQNQDVIYTIKVTNNGPNHATDVTISNQIPTGLTITDYSLTAGSLNLATGTWSVGTVVSGTSQTLLLYARPSATGSIALTATQTHAEYDGINSNNSATSTINVASTADVAVTNTLSPVKTTYTTGDNVTYTIVVTNNGPSTATNVVVNDKLSGTLAFTGYTATNGATYDQVSGNWSVGTLPSGASERLTINAKIIESAIITTTATQTHTEYDNVSGNNRATNSITSGSGTITADIAVTVSADAGPYYTGKPVTFTVKAENFGPDQGTNIQIDALLPASMKYESSAVQFGTYDAVTGIWNLGNLASGSSTELTIVAVPKPNLTTGNTATVTHSLTGSLRYLAQSQSANIGADSETETIVVDKAAEVGVSMTVTSSEPDGKYYNGLTTATFILTVTNNGPDRVTNLIGSDTRTGLLNFTYVEQGKGFNPATGIWNIGTLEPGETRTLEVRGIPKTTGRLNLGGWITAQDQFDQITENNKAVALLNVLPAADLKVTQTVTPGPYYNGQSTTFTVILENLGTDAATGVTLVNKLPEGLALVRATTTMGTYHAETGIWTLESDVLKGQSQTLTITAVPTTSTTLTLETKIKTVNEYDNVTSNNQASTSISTEKAADIQILAEVPATTRHVGVQTTFTIKATNLGPDAATNIRVQETLPTGFNFIQAATSAGSYDVTTGIWIVPALASNATADLVLTVVPNKTGSITNYSYKIASTEYDPNGQNSQSGNNRTTANIFVTDRAAIYTIAPAVNFYDLLKNDVMAFPTDPDGSISSARLAENSTLPAGITLANNGRLLVTEPLALRAGTYTIAVDLWDEFGNKSTYSNLQLVITADRDGDGVNDFDDIDDNNDGITDMSSSGEIDPYADANNDGVYNYADATFIYSGNRAFADANSDGINDWFDSDIDGIINSLDIDFDGDGIANAVEANGGSAPTAWGYNAATSILTGSVSANGMPVLAQTSSNSGDSRYIYPDSDGDSIADAFDLDSDNDGLPDLMEAQLTIGYRTKYAVDTDRDGLDNAYDSTCGCEVSGITSAVINTDGDANPDYLDIDSDNDLKSDMEESFDDNISGSSADDLMLRAANFSNGSYPAVDINYNSKYDWLEDDNFNGILNFQEAGHTYYYDTNANGIIALFDPATSGKAVVYQLNMNNKMNYRDAEVFMPLPVSLVSFTGKLQQEGVKLNWSTASEQNNDHFEIERGTDKKAFATVGYVKGFGNSNQKINYSFLDSSLPTTATYYRLKQVDANGRTTYSKPIVIQPAKAQLQNIIRLYPNPATETVKLDMTKLSTETFNISVISMEGRVVKELKLQGGHIQEIDLNNLAAGKYIIKVQGQDVVLSLRLIKR